jgi:hypothetical protein
MKSRIAFAFAALSYAILVVPCASDAFDQPQRYLGKHVCGYIHFRLEDTNIWRDHRAQRAGEAGLGLIYRAQTARLPDGGRACVSGQIIWTGCESDHSKICNWSDADYAVDVTIKTPQAK